jgi:anti-sigma factor RsiW
MNCNDVRRHWMLYVDSEGDPEMHFRINEHLGMCPSCAQWYAQQQRFEQGLTERLAATPATPDLWDRVLSRALVRPPSSPRRRWLVVAGTWGGGLAAAAAVIVAAILLIRYAIQPTGPELARLAADEHEQVLQGALQPEFVSTSDEEVDRYLKTRLSFPVHCPPRKDVAFEVQGARICRIKDERAALIVGQVDQTRVSILVFDRASVDAFPHARDQLAQGGGRHRSREGDMQVVSGVVAGNLVVVIGDVPPEKLEKLLNAYGTYPEG